MTTDLDRIKKSDTFDQEHIDIFVREGGMNVAEVEGMNQVDRILRGKVTDEELSARNVWQGIINESNSDNSNKYLEAQILSIDAQERRDREEAVARTAVFIAAMLENRRI